MHILIGAVELPWIVGADPWEQYKKHKIFI
ncbi:hypothetical protein ABIA22_005165 [Sinorhizobium fredii]